MQKTFWRVWRWGVVLNEQRKQKIDAFWAHEDELCIKLGKIGYARRLLHFNGAVALIFYAVFCISLFLWSK